jgi:UDP-N-acetylglucosamine 4,6-dehydratase
MLTNKTFFITGGTGSFGKKFIQKICQTYSPKSIVVYSRDELKQYELMQTAKENNLPIQFVLGDVRDLDRLRRAMKGSDIVIHAAALKHVPAAEQNPVEFIRTNVLGAHNVIEASLDNEIEKVVALSTDKACNPINLYGATKLAADKLFVSAGTRSKELGTIFSVVRYGNVIGSRGSVIPFFMHQAKKSVLPITDARMTRFLITLSQGVDLVFTALDRQVGGEIFIPKIPSMNIMDIASVVAPGVPTEFVGIRPGEKLHEVMISEDDARCTLDFGSYYAILAQERFQEVQLMSKDTAKLVRENFRYSSDANEEIMTRDTLERLLGQFELKGHELVTKVD